MTEIDLTEAVDSAARDLWIRSSHQGAPEGLVNQVRAEAAQCWDEGGLSYSQKHYYREIVRPVVTAAHKPIAAQAWDQGALAGHMEVGSDEEIPNPYREKSEPSPNEHGIYTTNGVHSAKRTTPFTRTLSMSCRCEFGWAHDCPHHGNKETR